MGWPLPADATAQGPWLLAGGLADELAARVPQVVARYRQLRPLEPGPPTGALRPAPAPPGAGLPPGVRRRAVERPDVGLREVVVRPPFVLRDGRVLDEDAALPAEVQRAVDDIRARLASDPSAAPEPPELVSAGLGSRELAAALRSGQLLRIADGVYLAPDVADTARARLTAVPQPFTLSQARQAWGTSRRVAVPLMEWLDAQRVTERLADNTRRLR